MHSVSLGAVNPNHRVTRRKSMTSTAAANAAAAVAATLNGGKDSNGESVGIPMGSSSHRRGLSGRKGLESSSLGSSSGLGSYLSRSVNDHAVGRKHSPQSTTPDGNNTAVDGGAPVVGKPVSTKNRNRRASEGSHLIRGEGKRVAGELRCERCGKGYKHSSCLSKHMCVCPHLMMSSSCRLARERSMLLLSCPCWLPACPASLSPLPLLLSLSLLWPRLVDMSLFG